MTSLRFLLLACALPWAGRAAVQLPADAPECVGWAGGDLAAALREQGVEAGQAQVAVSFGRAAGLDAQGFELAVRGSEVRLSAGGPVGAMYGLQELAEQVRAAPEARGWTAVLRSVHPTRQRPYVELRADNYFIHVYPLQLNDLEFWHAYIDMLARNRFNWLDLHGAYDLKTTSFPNLYPMLVHVPEYPQVGNAAEQTRNLASFRAIIAYAHRRGLQVAFMNYSANDGKGGAEKNAPSVTGVPPAQLADYTAKAVTRLIGSLPELDMLGFRVGESGQDAAFYRKAYIQGVLDAHRPDLRLYTRSWQTTQAQLEPIARIARAGFDIEIKYNGEQLGLPYPALQTRYGTYSYESYLDVPADYRIIWQVRANGTHRFWAWEDTEFIRRTVRTFTLGRARGFTLEPPNAYFDTDPAGYYRSAADAAVNRYQWQKYWMWHFAWGRLGYDPELPAAKLDQAYRSHFGAGGPAVERAIQDMSAILPLAFAYRFPGPDQRDFSPETETGMVPTKHSGKAPLLLQFIDHAPEDARSFVNIGEYVDRRLHGVPDGRVGPWVVARRLHAAAAATRADLKAIGPLAERAAAEWRLLEPDCAGAAEFGDYYASRIEALVHLDTALKTGSQTEYDLAQRGLEASRGSWNRLSQVMDGLYRPLANPLRKQPEFRWSALLPALEQVDAEAARLWPEHRFLPDARGTQPGAAEEQERERMTVADLAAETAAASATIHCRAGAPSGVDRVVLWWKPLPSQLAWRSLTMAPVGKGGYAAQIPLTREGAMYAVEVQAASDAARNFPDVFATTPYVVIPPR